MTNDSNWYKNVKKQLQIEDNFSSRKDIFMKVRNRTIIININYALSPEARRTFIRFKRIIINYD